MTGKITYADLLQLITEKTGAPKQDVLDLMKGLVDAIGYGLEKEGRAVVSGLGRFELRWQKAHTGRNPQTGEEMEIPAHSYVHFRPESALRRFINRKYAHLKPKMLKNKAALETEDFETDTGNDSVEEKTHEDNFPRKKSKKGWFWLILIVIIILLLILFWPKPKPVPPVSETPEKADTTIVEPEPVPEPVTTGTSRADHQVVAGDKLWELSQKYYGNTYLWPYIYRENKPVISNPDILIVSKNLIIPPLEGKPGSLTTNDRKLIADGYVQVYLVYQKMGKSNLHSYLWVAKQTGGPTVISPHENQIDDEDLKRIENIPGNVLIK